MNLYTILFGEFHPPVSTGRITHRMDGERVDPVERTGTITKQITDVILNNQGLSATEITNSIGASYGTVMSSLVRLMARGQLRRVKQGAAYRYFAR